MIIINKYKISFKNLEDNFLVVVPETKKDLEEFYNFRYNIYLEEGYIEYNDNHMDIDEYDNNVANVFHFGVKSNNQNRIIGYVRIITSKPLPIVKDCFVFNDPFLIKLFSRGNLLEISRLISDRYDKDKFLPRHFIISILIKEILSFSKNHKIYFGYAFLKRSLVLKFKSMGFPFFYIRNYKSKYKEGILLKYFNQSSNPVVPVYFNYYLVRIYIFFSFLKFNKYLCQ